jgi:hypothetical protein
VWRLDLGCRSPRVVHEALRRWRMRQGVDQMAALAKPRIFEHLDGVPEDRYLSTIAHRIKRSPMWTAIPRNEFAEVKSAVSSSEAPHAG